MAPAIAQPSTAPAPIPVLPNCPPAVPPAVNAIPAPVPAPDPGRDGWADLGVSSKTCGPFFGLELDIVKPSVKNQLSGIVTFPNGMNDRVTVPQASLDWTVAPSFEIGYHLSDSLGALLFNYRFLASEGTGNREATFGPASIKSRLNFNQFDLDYQTATYSPLPRYDLRFRFGARLATVYLDSQAADALESRQASSYFVGAGPAAAIDFERHFEVIPNLGIFMSADGSALTGQVQQRFRESIDDLPGASLSVRKTQTAETLRLQAGLVYHAYGVANDRLRFFAGYQFERWWGVGKINGSVAPDTVSSDAAITAQGLFLRAEYDF
jgi:hypothetical protein